MVGYEGFYSVSNLGRVRSEPRTVVRTDGVVTRLNGKLLAPRYNRKGYVVAALTRLAKPQYVTVHRLVVTAFVGAVPGDRQVNHINGVKDDNRASNLEIVTAGENVAHAYSMGLARPGRVWGEDSPAARLRYTDVVAIRDRYAAGDVTQLSLALEYGVGRRQIGRIVNRKRWAMLPVHPAHRHSASVWANA